MSASIDLYIPIPWDTSVEAILTDRGFQVSVKVNKPEDGEITRVYLCTRNQAKIDFNEASMEEGDRYRFLLGSSRPRHHAILLAASRALIEHGALDREMYRLLDPDRDGLCPECSSPLCNSRAGSCLLIHCSAPGCPWECATTFPVPILQDSTSYRLTIPALSEAPPAMLITLNHPFTHGIAITRQLVRRGELPPFTGGALDIWREAHRLRDAGVPFRIDPDYPFDLDSNESAFGPPDGPISRE